MEEARCEECGKKIEGFTVKHVDSLMRQHKFKHERDAEKKKKKK